MALYALGDLHLALGADKPMDVFGGKWAGYMDKLEASLSVLRPEDTLVIAGDFCWALGLEEAGPDFRFLNRFPGRKLLVKGNHDYWWNTAAKFRRFCEANGLEQMDLLHNNCHFYGEIALCGTRGWFFEEDQKPHNEKVLNREVGRLEASLKLAGGRPILAFLHYPPLYEGYRCPEILKKLEEYGVARCFYGHLHGVTHRRAIQGKFSGVDYNLVSADYLRFEPKKICE